MRSHTPPEGTVIMVVPACWSVWIWRDGLSALLPALFSPAEEGFFLETRLFQFESSPRFLLDVDMADCLSRAWNKWPGIALTWWCWYIRDRVAPIHSLSTKYQLLRGSALASLQH
ncbi:13.1 kd protein [Maize streak virus - Reunion [SP2R13]]|nr:13.1 kd protein [Maize streak virus - Reunion [SP2R13]]